MGGGLAGLAAARRVTGGGATAVVLERAAEPGGRVRSERFAGCTIELGAVFVTPRYRRVRRLIAECGLEGRLERIPSFRTGVRRGGRWHALDYRWPEVGLAAYSGLRLGEKLALARLVPSQVRVLAAMRFFDMATAAAIDTRPLERVVGAGANRYFASLLAEVFCNYPAGEVSLAFAALGARFPTRRGWTLDGGLGALPRALAERLDVRCGVAVERARATGDAVEVETSSGERLVARAAIVATRAHEALAIWPDATQNAREFLSEQSYSRGLGVFLRTSTPIQPTDRRGRPLYMRTLPRGEGGDALLAVVYLNDAAPDGGLILLDAYAEAVDAADDDEELAARLEAELAAVHPEAAELVTARRVVRWDPFVPLFPAGRSRELAKFRSTLQAGPVQLAGDYLHGPLMEGAVRAGEEAADRALAHLSRAAT